jgi:protein-tyrosine phosphatase
MINEQLATHGLEAQRGTGIADDMIQQPDEAGMIDGFKVFDIREMMLDAPSPISIYRRLANITIKTLRDHGKVVICCSAGVSRSNAIAILVLIKHFGMHFEDACSLVREKVPIADPLPCHISQIRKYCAWHDAYSCNNYL